MRRRVGGVMQPRGFCFKRESEGLHPWRTLETIEAKDQASGPGQCSRRWGWGHAHPQPSRPAPAPYPEERRVLLRLVPLLGRVLPGDAEEGLALVLPAQARVAPALNLQHQPVTEPQGTPGPRRVSSAIAIGDLPFFPPPGVAGHQGCRAGGQLWARSDRATSAKGDSRATRVVRGGSESESLAGQVSLSFLSLLPGGPLLWSLPV